MAAQQIEDKLNSVFGAGFFACRDIDESTVELVHDKGAARYSRSVLAVAVMEATDPASTQWWRWVKVDPSDITQEIETAARLEVLWDLLTEGAEDWPEDYVEA